MKWWTCETNGVTDVGRVICCQLKYLRPFSALFASVARRVCLRSGVKTWRKEKKKKRTEEYENKLTEERERERGRERRDSNFFFVEPTAIWGGGEEVKIEGKKHREGREREKEERPSVRPLVRSFFSSFHIFFYFSGRDTRVHTHTSKQNGQ